MTKPKQITQESSLKSETVICTALGMLPGNVMIIVEIRSVVNGFDHRLVKINSILPYG